MDSRDTYKERGTGLLKVNVRKSDGRGARLGANSISGIGILVNVFVLSSYASRWRVQVDPEC
jgi:hypothetical protein